MSEKEMSLQIEAIDTDEPIEITVNYDYEAEEASSLYSPGTDESVSIIDVLHDGISIKGETTEYGKIKMIENILEKDIDSY